VIIGGGIHGCAAAFFLARRGLRAIVIEKDPGTYFDPDRLPDKFFAVKSKSATRTTSEPPTLSR
jgi:thioredoxin reductase